jgi:L-lactate dehydrogenase (cytochrome)
MRSATQAICIEDLRKLARHRVPSVVFDYLDGAADGEVTARENIAAFDDYLFRPRLAVKTGAPRLATTVLGQPISFPAMPGPLGYSRLFHPDGEIGAARAAGKAGTGYVQSTLSGYRLEESSAATSGPFFYQFYLLGGRATGEATLARAAAAGAKGLFVTIDTPVAGLRRRDFRNGMRELMAKPSLPKLRYLPDVLLHPRWIAGYLRGGRMPVLPNVVVPGKGAFPLTDAAAALESSAITWDDMAWIRRHWKGPLCVKGVHTDDDARRAVDHGAQGVVVSNHGGRQLDGVAATLRVLPEVVAAVGGQCEVLLDGGVRHGSDIAKALALGARAVLLGRGYGYGLAAAGEKGVTRALEIFRSDLERTMKLLGCADIAELNESYLQRR